MKFRPGVLKTDVQLLTTMEQQPKLKTETSHLEPRIERRQNTIETHKSSLTPLTGNTAEGSNRTVWGAAQNNQLVEQITNEVRSLTICPSCVTNPSKSTSAHSGSTHKTRPLNQIGSGKITDLCVELGIGSSKPTDPIGNSKRVSRRRSCLSLRGLAGEEVVLRLAAFPKRHRRGAEVPVHGGRAVLPGRR
jgi:hypothetical protein